MKKFEVCGINNKNCFQKKKEFVIKNRINIAMLSIIKNTYGILIFKDFHLIVLIVSLKLRTEIKSIYFGYLT